MLSTPGIGPWNWSPVLHFVELEPCPSLCGIGALSSTLWNWSPVLHFVESEPCPSLCAHLVVLSPRRRYPTLHPYLLTLTLSLVPLLGDVLFVPAFQFASSSSMGATSASLSLYHPAHEVLPSISPFSLSQPHPAHNFATVLPCALTTALPHASRMHTAPCSVTTWCHGASSPQADQSSGRLHVPCMCRACAQVGWTG